MSREALLALIDSLDRLVRRLSLRLSKSTWSDYYENNSYGHDALRQKRQIVGRMLDEIRPESAWDLGANTGVFSRLAAERGAYTCSFELDALCVEQNFRQCREANSDRVLPLRLDLTNPSAAIGWAGDERQSLAQRGPCDTALALALVHHLAIGNNVPLPRIAEFLAGVCRCLVIEWVPKEDPQVRRLLATRADIFLDYHREGFEAAVSRHFEIVNRAGVGDDGRVLYLLKSNP
jgi:ribosomal protein L11 methylase PrmA